MSAFKKGVNWFIRYRVGNRRVQERHASDERRACTRRDTPDRADPPGFGAHRRCPGSERAGTLRGTGVSSFLP